MNSSELEFGIYRYRDAEGGCCYCAVSPAFGTNTHTTQQGCDCYVLNIIHSELNNLQLFLTVCQPPCTFLYVRIYTLCTVCVWFGFDLVRARAVEVG